MVEEKPKKIKKLKPKKPTDKPEDEDKVITEELIALKPTDEILEEKAPEEEIQLDIESEVGVETKKKLVKKLTKTKEPTAELQDADEKEITEETTVIVTEEIIELPDEEVEKPEDETKTDEDKPKKKKKVKMMVAKQPSLWTMYKAIVQLIVN